jgi:hypothetical protein
VPVAGTKLLWISNAESDVVRLGRSGTIYYLVAAAGSPRGGRRR